MSELKPKISVFWFRRDLRVNDNAGLYHALRNETDVLPLFIFDINILNKLANKNDARVTFIYDVLKGIKSALKTLGSDIIIKYGDPLEVWKELLENYQVNAVFTNHDYETYAIDRDAAVSHLLEHNGIIFKTFKDHVIFEKAEVVKDDGKPYTVFTPYKKKWLAKLLENCNDVKDSYYLKPFPTEKYFGNFCKTDLDLPFISLEEMGFEPSEIAIPSQTVSQSIIAQYDQKRDFPAIQGTSRLGIHFRFGTISIREKALKAASLNQTYLSELIWRDFYAQILSHFPHVQKGSFRPEYDQIQWRNNEAEFKAWCEGKTGYPIVDAGMRELKNTGHMHNRVRMITASFLTKHLLIDWRWGEAWFAEKLLDFDLASNNGGWQWAAGSGTDAAPYFRIFSPDAQTDRFDKQKIYIKKWVPEYGTFSYNKPIVDHKLARERCLETYKKALAK
ncbi:MAG TPA: deoxyribodipyrimidine photo-lyase [Saprospiraceae bacterium]|nr:deoxyribodipyrimidine photo-lyase [Saprospiraceae bacterium]